MHNKSADLDVTFDSTTCNILHYVDQPQNAISMQWDVIAMITTSLRLGTA